MYKFIVKRLLIFWASVIYSPFSSAFADRVIKLLYYRRGVLYQKRGSYKGNVFNI